MPQPAAHQRRSVGDLLASPTFLQSLSPTERSELLRPQACSSSRQGGSSPGNIRADLRAGHRGRSGTVAQQAASYTTGDQLRQETSQAHYDRASGELLQPLYSAEGLEEDVQHLWQDSTMLLDHREQLQMQVEELQQQLAVMHTIKQQQHRHTLVAGQDYGSVISSLRASMAQVSSMASKVSRQNKLLTAENKQLAVLRSQQTEAMQQMQARIQQLEGRLLMQLQEASRESLKQVQGVAVTDLDALLTTELLAASAPTGSSGGGSQPGVQLPGELITNGNSEQVRPLFQELSALRRTQQNLQRQVAQLQQQLSKAERDAQSAACAAAADKAHARRTITQAHQRLSAALQRLQVLADRQQQQSTLLQEREAYIARLEQCLVQQNSDLMHLASSSAGGRGGHRHRSASSSSNLLPSSGSAGTSADGSGNGLVGRQGRAQHQQLLRLPNTQQAQEQQQEAGAQAGSPAAAGKEHQSKRLSYQQWMQQQEQQQKQQQEQGTAHQLPSPPLAPRQHSPGSYQQRQQEATQQAEDKQQQHQHQSQQTGARDLPEHLPHEQQQQQWQWQLFSPAQGEADQQQPLHVQPGDGGRGRSVSPPRIRTNASANVMAVSRTAVAMQCRQIMDHGTSPEERCEASSPGAAQKQPTNKGDRSSNSRAQARARSVSPPVMRALRARELPSFTAAARSVGHLQRSASSSRGLQRRQSPNLSHGSTSSGAAVRQIAAAAAAVAALERGGRGLWGSTTSISTHASDVQQPEPQLPRAAGRITQQQQHQQRQLRLRELLQQKQHRKPVQQQQQQQQQQQRHRKHSQEVLDDGHSSEDDWGEPVEEQRTAPAHSSATAAHSVWQLRQRQPPPQQPQNDDSTLEMSADASGDDAGGSCRASDEGVEQRPQEQQPHVQRQQNQSVSKRQAAGTPAAQQANSKPIAGARWESAWAAAEAAQAASQSEDAAVGTVRQVHGAGPAGAPAGQEKLPADSAEGSEPDDGLMAEVLAMQQDLQHLEEDLMQLGCEFEEPATPHSNG